MKVAILGPVYTPSYFGGVATFDENLALGFKKLGHEAILFTNQKDAPKYISEIRVMKPRLSIIKHYEPFDIVLCSLAYSRYFIYFNSGVKAYFLHGYFYMPEIGFLKTFLATAYQKYFFRYSDYIICNSEFTRFMNMEAFNISADGSVFLAPSYDFLQKVDQFQRVDAPNKLLYVGRLVKAKYVDNILKALVELKNRGKEFQLTIVGDGNIKESLIKYSYDNKLNVYFAGRVNQKDIIKYYKTNDMFISLNPSEPFGITFCEALVSGCKIICPKTGGQIEFLSRYPERVRMVSERNYIQIADAIQELSSIHAYKEISKSEFSYEKTALSIMKVINKT